MKAVIVGAGCFGMFTAFFLNKAGIYDEIKVVYKELENTASTQGARGFYKNKLSHTVSLKHLKIRQFNGIYKFLIFMFIYFFCHPRTMINKIVEYSYSLLDADFAAENLVDCGNGYFYWEKDYLSNLKESLAQEASVEFIQENFDKSNYPDHDVIYCNGDGDIPAYFDKIYQDIHGTLTVIEVEDPPTCFGTDGTIFWAPYEDKKIIVAHSVEIGSKTCLTSKHVNKLKSNTYLNNFTIKNIEESVCHSRRVTYDGLPFISNYEGDYYLNGGSFLGTHTGPAFAYWLVEYIKDSSFKTSLIDFSEFRLTKYYYLFYLWLYVLVIIISISIWKI